VALEILNFFCVSQRVEDVRRLLFRQRMVVIIITEASETVGIAMLSKLLGEIWTLCAGERLASLYSGSRKGRKILLLRDVVDRYCQRVQTEENISGWVCSMHGR
jgi:hypothetical protein